jgi:hypothetical protein
MKALLPMIACVAVIIGVALFTLTTRADAARDAARDAAPLTGTPGRASSVSEGQVGELLARIETLSERVDQLSMEVTGLRTAAARAPIPSAIDAEVAAATLATSAVPREAIVEVIAEERERLEAQRIADKEQRELDRVLARAETISRELGLTPGEEKVLGDVLLEERQLADALLADLKLADTRAEKVEMKKAFGEVATWRDQELAKRLGPVTSELVTPFFDKNRKTDDRAAARGADRAPDRRAQDGNQKTGGKRRRGNG